VERPQRQFAAACVILTAACIIAMRPWANAPTPQQPKWQKHVKMELPYLRTATWPYKGVVVATYTDYKCPFCAKAAETIEPWLRKEPTVRFAVMDVIVHSDSALAAVAALCMGEPNSRGMSIGTSDYRGPSIPRMPRSADRFWAMRSAIYR